MMRYLPVLLLLALGCSVAAGEVTIKAPKDVPVTAESVQRCEDIQTVVKVQAIVPTLPEFSKDDIKNACKSVKRCDEILDTPCNQLGGQLIDTHTKKTKDESLCVSKCRVGAIEFKFTVTCEE